jgi:hypothetical protein
MVPLRNNTEVRVSGPLAAWKGRTAGVPFDLAQTGTLIIKQARLR